MKHPHLAFFRHLPLYILLFLPACNGQNENNGNSNDYSIVAVDSIRPVDIPEPEPAPQPESVEPPKAKPNKQTLELSVHNYLEKNFNTKMVIFTYAGNVDIKNAAELDNGGYYLEGEFDYKNAIDLQVKRSFRTTVKIFLEEYAVQEFEFLLPDIDNNWSWNKL